MEKLRFWLWHRWFGHGPWEVLTFSREGEDLSVRVCARCDRCHPDDVLAVCDKVEGFLDALEKVMSRQP